MRAIPIKQLEKRIRSAARQDMRVMLHALNIHSLSSDEHLALAGLAEDIPSKRITMNIARNLANDMFTLEDHLRVRTSEVSDAELRDKIARTLLNEPIFRNITLLIEEGDKTSLLRDHTEQNSDLIKATIHNGLIRLTGRVNSLTHRRLAEVLLWWIEGCKCLDNQLRVLPPEHDSDAELADAIRIILEKDPLLDAGQIRFSINEGVVELRGHLTSTAQKRIATQDVWAVPDVWEVYDRITVEQGAIQRG